MTFKDFHSLQGIVEWAAFHNLDHLLEAANAQLIAAGVEVNPRAVKLMIFVQIIEVSRAFKYGELSDEEKDMTQNIDQLDYLVGAFGELEKSFGVQVSKPQVFAVKRLCAIQKLLRYISRAVCGGEIPVDADDFTVKVKTFDFRSCKVDLEGIFESCESWYATQDEFAEDCQFFIEDLGKTTKTKFLMCVSEIIRRFEDYSIENFKKAIQEFVDDIKRKIPPITPVLNVTFLDQQGRELLISEGEDWTQAKRDSHGPYADVPRSARKSLLLSEQRPILDVAEGTQQVVSNLQRVRKQFDETAAENDPLKSIQTHKSRGPEAKSRKRAPSPSNSPPSKKTTAVLPPVTASDTAAQIVAAVGSEVASLHSESESEFDKEFGQPSRSVQLLQAAAVNGQNQDETNLPAQLGTPPRKELRSTSTQQSMRRKWTHEEERALLGGIGKFGVSNWATILEDPEFGFILRHRSNVNLKDKFRNMMKAGTIDPTFSNTRQVAHTTTNADESIDSSEAEGE